IVLNGHVGAIAKLFVKNGETRFHAIVDPRLLDPAGDEIAVYSIAAGGDGAIRLHPLRREGAARAAARGSGAPTPGDDG
ncbi:MAG TPA: hypothetical protein VLC53_16240, partial [Myxococcota bacterium]|nr:hypothetical protein [Myxococcota bacterium]